MWLSTSPSQATRSACCCHKVDFSCSSSPSTIDCSTPKSSCIHGPCVLAFVPLPLGKAHTGYPLLMMLLMQALGASLEARSRSHLSEGLPLAAFGDTIGVFRILICAERVNPNGLAFTSMLGGFRLRLTGVETSGSAAGAAFPRQTCRF